MLANLRPVSNENSIRQVIGSVFSKSKLIEPKRFEKYLNELKGYQKFELIQQNAFNISFNGKNSNDNIISSREDVGFRLVAFNEGRINKIFSIEQKQSEFNDLTLYNHQSLKYPKWEFFKNDLINDLEIISKEDNPFISAIALNYLNEFAWESDDDIVIDEIFNKDAGYMSTKFFNSQNSSFLISTENYKTNYKSIEQLEIVVSKQRKIIQINSQLVFELVNPVKLSSSIFDNSLSDYFEEIHIDIKKTLQTLFTKEVKSKINLYGI